MGRKVEGIKIELKKNVRLIIEDKTTISLNHHSSGRDTVLIICPGCFMCKDAKPFLQMAEDFAEHFDVIAMDFRGHGQSSGLFTFTAREHLDLKAVVDYARKKYRKVVLLGFSLGAATAMIYAAKHKEISGVIAVSAPSRSVSGNESFCPISGKGFIPATIGSRKFGRRILRLLLKYVEIIEVLHGQYRQW